MKIRLATLSDKKKVLRLLDELGCELNKKLGSPPHNTEAQNLGGPKFEEIVRRNDTHIFVVQENGDLIGLVSLYILPNMRHGYYRGHIEDMVVTESKRRKGVGSGLINAVKKYCKENNICVIKLDSGLELTDAHRFYEKLGGKPTEKIFRFDL